MKKRKIIVAALCISILLCGLCCVKIYEKLNPPDGITFYVKEAGYYDFLVNYEAPVSQTSFQSLYLNGRFVRKIRFEQENESLLRVPVYFEKGLNTVQICSRDGDDEIAIRDLKYEKRERPIKMIIAPHEDDEILGFAASIYRMNAAGDDVRVVFVTNGDFQGANIGKMRFAESIGALQLFGIEPENITFLGYPDSGLMSMIADPDTPVNAMSGETHTYADPDQGIYEYHWMQHGEHAALTGKNVRADLLDLLTAVRPAEIYLTSRHDTHTDHYSVFEMTVRTIQTLQKKKGYGPLMHETVIHGYNDMKWPERTQWDENGNPVVSSFTNPFPDGYGDFDWESATHIPVTPEVLGLKQEAIGMFYTQNVIMGWDELNHAYLKNDEFYWTTDFSK